MEESQRGEILSQMRIFLTDNSPSGSLILPIHRATQLLRNDDFLEKFFLLFARKSKTDESEPEAIRQTEWIRLLKSNIIT
ncbi:unnamed protein product [Darwinula stevensoni]|uniref:Uncharacterized protein n=1 Tax=Darwinula stevensoni TaxID=69355 RepID=A0A7R9AGC9_9CRUS|nr:unnamed protein product [Darwinula stevensoni]CAG0903921.1 unnamed protein product [Darwinula stevensoni]